VIAQQQIGRRPAWIRHNQGRRIARAKQSVRPGNRSRVIFVQSRPFRSVAPPPDASILWSGGPEEAHGLRWKSWRQTCACVTGSRSPTIVPRRRR
jgi:hypothetical protein